MNQGNFALARWFRSPLGVCLMVGAALSALYLGVAHTAHVLGALPYLMLLLCPALHLLMHGGHGNHENHPHEQRTIASKPISKENPGCH